MNAQANDLGKKLRGTVGSAGWWVVLRGVLMIIFGMYALARPGLGLSALVIMFAIWAMADGVAAGIAAFAHDRTAASRLWLLLAAGVGIGAGIFAIGYPGPTAIMLFVVVAARAVIVGVVEAVDAIRLRHVIGSPWLLALSGLASVAFGMLLLGFPTAGLLTLGWLIGAYALFVGALQLATGVSLVEVSHRPPVLGSPSHMPA